MNYGHRGGLLVCTELRSGGLTVFAMNKGQGVNCSVAMVDCRIALYEGQEGGLYGCTELWTVGLH
jgi:hypothetical protein